MRYKLFGKHTGLRVSELVLGTGNFGTGWGYGTEREESLQVFNAYAEAGGNFIDTADAYQGGQSEEILGGALVGRRTDFVLATKYTMPVDAKANILTTGNSRKAMVAAVEASLKRLKTDWVDVLWIHFADNVTPAEEIVRGFDDLARAGKITYAGLSNFAAWRVARIATIAEIRNTLPIAGLQFEHSLVERTAEQELIPAANALGIGTLAYSPQGGGMLTGKYRQGEKGRREGFGGKVFQEENSAQRTAVLDAVIKVAEELGVTPGQVAVAWVAAKGSLPIIGPKTVTQLEANLASAEIKLSAEQITTLDTVSDTPEVYPHSAINSPGVRQSYTGGKFDQLDIPADTVA